MPPTKLDVKKGGGKVRIPADPHSRRQIAAGFAFTNHSNANPGTVTVTDAAGNVIFDAQLGPGASCKLSGTALPPLDSDSDVTVTASPTVDGTLTASPVYAGQ